MPVPMRSRAVLAALLVPLGVVVAACGEEKKPPPRPPTPVVVALAVTGSVPITLSSNGTVEPLQTVAVQPQASGPIMAVRFAEGDEVKEGQVLFEIDARPARAELAQAQAVLARDRAQAAAARADAARYESLVAQGYVTQSQAAQFRATADALGATVAADQAAVETARLSLAYTTVRAPISGKTGALNVRLGNQVRVPNPVPLVTINAVSPVLVRFPVPDRALAEVRAAQRNGKLDVIASGAATGGVVEHGRVEFIDNAVDSVTGSVTVKARFANADRRLWPGTFLPVTVVLGETPNAVLVPSVAVQQGPNGSYVFVPDSAGRAQQVPVTVDRLVDEVAVISKGVRAGQQVVVDGQSRLFAKAPLRVARTVPVTLPGRGPVADADSGAVGVGGARAGGGPTSSGGAAAGPNGASANGAGRSGAGGNGTGTSGMAAVAAAGGR